MELCHSLQLFNKHVFKRDTPPEGYDILSKSIVSIAAGLPFAVKAIGSSLLNKKKEVWEAKLTQLKDKLDDNVHKKLRTSYDDLSATQKQIFLDIACLFIGEDKRLPFYMWDDCKFHPSWEIKVLQFLSMVKIEDGKWLWMHDQLRDLGRQIVREEEEPSRLFVDEDALNVLESQIERRKVEAICVKAYNHCFTHEEFRNLPDLRVLRIDYAELDGDFKCLLLNLRWLQWRKCPGNSTPINFHLKNLVILDLSNSCYLKDDWEGWSQIKMAKKLKVLNLSGCNSLTRTPDFSTFTALEILNLRNSQYLKDDLEGWSQIKIAKKLKVLNLSRCNGLTRTPDFSTFTALEILIIGMCENLVEFHPSIWELKILRVLDISTDGHASPAIAITKFPDEIENLEKLEEINASNCWHLQGEIPSSIGRLSSLRILRLDNTKIGSLPTSICGLSRLQTLDLLKCKGLQSLPDELPHSLMHLRVTCKSMETFPSLSNLINLKEFIFDPSNNLVEIPIDIGKLSKLETLCLWDCTKISTLPAEIGALSRLKVLELNFSNNLHCIKVLPSSLFELLLDNCTSMESLPNLSNLRMLKELKLRKCPKLAKVEGLGVLKSLERLDVSGCTSLQLDLSNLKNLKELRIRDCKNLTEIQGLEELESLGFLDMAGCKLIENLPDLSNLKKLKILIAFFCEKLTEIRGLEELKSLKLLDISGCKSIERLLDLSNTWIDTNSRRAKRWEAGEAEKWEGREQEEWWRWESEEWGGWEKNVFPEDMVTASPSPK